MDADWGEDRSRQRSVKGRIVVFVGSVIAYRTKFQSTVPLKSVKAEFTGAAEAGEMARYLRSILTRELGKEQHILTTIYEKNMSALFMAAAD